MRTLEKVFYLVLFLVTCFVQFGMSQDTSVWWQDNYTIVVSKQFKGVVPLKNPTGFKVYKGTKYVTVILEMPDSSKSYNVSLAAYPLDTTVPPPDPVITTTEVNNNDPLVKYSTGWSYQAKTATVTWPDPFLNDDIHYTFTLNSWVEYTFTGDKIEVFSEFQANHGKARVEIKNTAGTLVHTEVIDMYSATRINSRDLVFTRTLPKGTYTIRLTLSEVNTSLNPRRDSMVFDSFKSYSTK